MAIIWQKTVNQVHYEVRAAGNTRRLYTNRVCHSEYNPGHVFTGSIWDLLILPAFYYQPTEIQRVLVLGVGGGSTLLQLHHFFKSREIIGIESDSVHIHVAKKYFRVEKPGVSLINADAVEWLQNYNGEPFDMIIDDLFCDEGKQPVRAVEVDRYWTNCLLKHLSTRGVLTVNFGSKEELSGAVACLRSFSRKSFPGIFQLTSPSLDNYVGAFIGKKVDSKVLRARLAELPETQRALQSKKLRYRIRRLE